MSWWLLIWLFWTEHGIQFKFSIGTYFLIKRDEVNLDIILEQKRQLYLNPLPIRVTGTEQIEVTSLREFITRVNGLKHSVHGATTLRVYLETLEFKKTI